VAASLLGRTSTRQIRRLLEDHSYDDGLKSFVPGGTGGIVAWRLTKNGKWFIDRKSIMDFFDGGATD